MINKLSFLALCFFSALLFCYFVVNLFLDISANKWALILFLWLSYFLLFIATLPE